ncbi:DUF2491 family protein [Roseibium sp. RKSG952]|uniref:DUF2491 family protein n=1 Tax=Roseibium sp. RKSG952 TaxID=2529384 RepID=UPI0012BD31B5|nr:DUF2491 family protein [Roseibium sp. RKSG952]MTH96139.1 DUF2491 family protein [Roseibium sp. RKSG952]
MFDWLTGKKKNKEAEKPKLPIIYDYTIGRDLAIEPTYLKLLPQEGFFEVDRDHFMISAQGKIDFGEQTFCHRFYDDQDTVLFQILGSEDGDRIYEMKLWSYFKVENPNDARWEELKVLMKGETFVLHGDEGKAVFVREWFADDVGPAGPVTYWETVYDEVDGKGREIFQTAMLFSRELPGGSFEYLLVNLEEPTDGDRTATFMIGVPITRSELNV